MFIERLNQFIESKGLTINSFEKECGLSVGVIAKAINKKTYIRCDTLEKITERYPEINLDWLFNKESFPNNIHHNLTNVSAGRDIINSDTEKRELQIRVEYLERIVEEKERTIAILMRGNAAENNAQ